MKINYWLILLLIIFSPTQLGLHFWPEWSFVNGIKIDYLAPTIYLTDLFLVGLIIMTAAKFRGSKFLKTLTAIFLILLFLSGRGDALSAYWSLRYLQIPIITWLIYVNGKDLSFPKVINKCLSVSLIFILFLEAWQFIIKKSTGWWWVFGERSFSLSTPNVATIGLLGQKFLRPYATFSHPNALAGWLLLALFILWESKPRRFLAIAGILLTFSRNAILAGLIGIISYSVFANRILAQSIIVFSEDSSAERIILNQAALRIFQDHPVFGIGPGKLLPALPGYFPLGFWKLQPPHNIYYLVLAETGIVGLVILAIGLLSFYPFLKKNPVFFPGLIAVFSTSILDHYWLTSQQNRILLGIFLGLCLIRGFRSDHQSSVPTFAFRKRSNVRSGRKLHVDNSSFRRS